MSDADAALRRLHATWPAPRPPRVEGCPHCVSEADVAALAAGEPAALERYAAKAVTTWGTEVDLRGMLPDLLAHCPWEVADRLPGLGWASWPDDERQGVLDVLAARWEADGRGDLEAELLQALRPDVEPDVEPGREP